MIKGRDHSLRVLSDDAYKPLPIHTKDFHTLIADDGNGTRIYRDYHNGNIAVIHRGTQSMVDAVTNIHAALKGIKNTARYKRSKAFVENFAKNNNLDPRTFTYSGHSLGSALAQVMANEFNSEVIGFNPPVYIDVPEKNKGRIYVGDKDFVTPPSEIIFDKEIQNKIEIPAAHSIDKLDDTYKE